MVSSQRSSTPTTTLLGTSSEPRLTQSSFSNNSTTQRRANALAAAEYAAELDSDLTPQSMPARPPVDIEQAFGDASRDALYAIRDAIRDLSLVAAYTDNATIANRLRNDGGSPEALKTYVDRLQTILVQEAEAYASIMFGATVDMRPRKE